MVDFPGVGEVVATVERAAALPRWSVIAMCPHGSVLTKLHDGSAAWGCDGEMFSDADVVRATVVRIGARGRTPFTDAAERLASLWGDGVTTSSHEIYAALDALVDARGKHE